MTHPNRDQRIEAALRHALQPDFMHLVNESHLHVGHEGSKGGLGHYALTLSSPHFQGLSLIACHRLVYAALGALMQTDIHALRIEIIDPKR